MKYYPLTPVIASASQMLLNDFQYAGHTLFNDSLDIFTIKKETFFGSRLFENVDVRITSVINLSTGEKRSDDFKQLIFDPMGTFKPSIGYLFFFDDNYWLGTFTDSTKSVLTNIIVRRCNEQLRWIGDDGVAYSEYCILDYSISGTRDLVRQDDVPLPQGYVSIYAQLNERTELIKPNQRFLFGRPKQRVCWRVFGNGIMNSQNTETLSDLTARIVTFTVGAYQIDPQLDNLELGVADYYKNSFEISLSASQISGNIGESYPLSPTLLINDVPTSASFTYGTSSSSIASVSASGIVTLNASGSAIATAYMGGNSAISASALVSVSASGTLVEEIRITPSDNVSIIEGDTTTFTSYLYINNVQQTNSFTFSLANANVPTDHYSLYPLTSNSFSVENIERYYDYPLLITASSGSYTKQISINLEGAF